MQAQPPQNFTAKFEDKIEHNPKFTQFFFEMTEPYRFGFQAGQYISIKINEQGERRSYSICSSPSIQHGFELLVDLTPGGKGSQFFKNLQFGQEVSFLGPMGNFMLVEDTQMAPALKKPIVFVATGSGITPFKSMINHLLQDNHDSRPITLHWGLRHLETMIWENEFELLSKSFPNFSFHPVVSRAPQEWPLCRGRVTDCLSIHKINIEADYYLCGGKDMITQVQGLLLQRGVAGDKIHFEKFF